MTRSSATRAMLCVGHEAAQLQFTGHSPASPYGSLGTTREGNQILLSPSSRAVRAPPEAARPVMCDPRDADEKGRERSDGNSTQRF